MRANAGRAPLSRLLQVLMALQADRCLNAGALARLCEVSRRTIYRDLEALQAAGIPVHYVAERQGYQLAPGFTFQPPGLDEDEARALVVLAHTGGWHQGPGLHRRARDGVRKLVAALPGESRSRLRSLAELVAVRSDPGGLDPGRRAVYEGLLEALSRRVQARVGYQEPGTAGEYSTKVSTYRMVISMTGWTVVGRSTLHRQVRMFRVPWVRWMELTDDPYEIPPRFELDRFLAQAREAGEGSERHTVRLRFSPAVAPEVADGHWHPSQRFEHLPSGGIELHLLVDWLDEVLGWVLRFGDQVEVLAPDRLRHRVREVAERLLERHAANGHSPPPPERKAQQAALGD